MSMEKTLYRRSAAGETPQHHEPPIQHIQARPMNAARDAFLAAMRQVAATVTVVTTDGPEGRMGATVSAFTSLSADPPMVLVCLKRGSRIARAVAANGVFTVNVLPEDAHELARRFAGVFDDETPDRFHGTDFTATDFGPVLPRATAFTCNVEQSYHHATHEICIGAVTGISNAGEQPLTYLHGAFHVVRPKQLL
ncbi:flavin reductase family protein [Roseovarius salincola]|uniref:flavin reductase family protein n=1 Tax=Roseovarius salincola TaxID=2978479 RepID=UPI0022A8C567|nr:flavin reductase family protein [Roseovarius sp. EGI FJ00037]